MPDIDEKELAALVAIPIIEESATVSKRVVDRGGYRITKTVRTRDESIDQELTQEQVEVERRPVNRPVDTARGDKPYFDGDTWVVPVLGEVLVTEIRMMVVEEIRVTRTRHTTKTTQAISLRHDEIAIDVLDPESRLDKTV